MLIGKLHVRVGWWWNGLTHEEVFCNRHGFRAFWPIIIAWYEPE